MSEETSTDTLRMKDRAVFPLLDVLKRIVLLIAEQAIIVLLVGFHALQAYINRIEEEKQAPTPPNNNDEDSQWSTTRHSANSAPSTPARQQESEAKSSTNFEERTHTLYVAVPKSTMPVATVSGTSYPGGIKAYYQAKIEAAELTINERTQNLRRLEAQRNALNARGM